MRTGKQYLDEVHGLATLEQLAMWRYVGQAFEDGKDEAVIASLPALILLREVYRQAGDAAPPDRRHVLTPALRDEIRDYLKANGGLD